MRKTSKTVATLAAAGLLTAGLAATLAGPAYAAPAPKISIGQSLSVTAKPTDTSTTVVVAPGMAKRLQSSHISLKPTGAASTSTKGGQTTLSFPTTGTHPTETAVTHAGGVTFTNGKAKLQLTEIRLNLPDQSLSARLDNDGRADIFSVAPGQSGADAGRISLNKLTAQLLNVDFHSSGFKAGQAFGTVQLPEELGSGSGSSFNETINITNNTKYTLDFVGINTKNMGKVTSTPKQTLSPGAQDPGNSWDSISYESNNAGGGLVDISYRIDGTETIFDAIFQVPTIGFNEAACTQSSTINFSTCKIGSGYHPTATWVITDAS